MNKKLFILLLSLSGIAFWSSCVDDDDEYTIDEAWKAYQEEIVSKTAANPAYNKTLSASNNGNIYWKSIDDFVPDTGDENFNPELSPLFTDSVYVRYHGWYYKQDGDSIPVTTTEGTTGNGRVDRGLVSDFMDGYATMLQNMDEGQQIQVCIPQKLNYGGYSANNAPRRAGYGSSGSSGTIPAYTTLWFNIKLMKVKKR